MNTSIQMRHAAVTGVAVSPHGLPVHGRRSTAGLQAHRRDDPGRRMNPCRLTIDPSDLAELKEPFLWRPGKKTGTALHKHAKNSGLSYLASVPLGEENSWSGLLVCGDRQADPSDTLLKVLEIIAGILWSAISHHVSVGNLNLSSVNTARTLLIRNAITENAQEGVLLLNPNLTISELNPSAELILGYASHEVSGMPVEDVLIGSDSLTAAYNTALQGIPISNLGSHQTAPPQRHLLPGRDPDQPDREPGRRAGHRHLFTRHHRK